MPPAHLQRHRLGPPSDSGTLYRCGNIVLSVDRGGALLFTVNRTVRYPQVVVLRAGAAGATFQSRESRTVLPPLSS